MHTVQVHHAIPMLAWLSRFIDVARMALQFDFVPRPTGIGHGEVLVKPNIDRLDGEVVRFVDGTSEKIDIIVYCTGYRITFPFFDAKLLAAPDNSVPPLSTMAMEASKPSSSEFVSRTSGSRPLFITTVVPSLPVT